MSVFLMILEIFFLQYRSVLQAFRRILNSFWKNKKCFKINNHKI